MSDPRDIILTEEDGSYWVTCWNCGGAGYHADECVCQSVEDVCMCAEPEPPVCEECKGEGVLLVKPDEDLKAELQEGENG